MTILIAYPWLAAVVAGLFYVLYRRVPRRIILMTALAWLAYSAYEYGMKLRFLCSGECNIRVDLLLLYPALLIASIFAAVAFFRARR